MSKWPIKKLGSLIEEVSERNRHNDCLDVYSVTNSQGFIPSKDYFNKKVFSKDISNYKLVQRGMFAYNPSRINVGSISWLQEKDCTVVSPLYVVFRIHEDMVLQDWIAYFLRSDMGLAQIRSLTSGSVRDTLKYSALERIEIPIAPINEQREIVRNLKDIDQAIKTCSSLMEKTEELIKSRFIELFGDLAFNPMTWKRTTLVDVCADKGDIKCGPFGTQLGKHEYTKEGVPLWGIPQINAAFAIPPTDFITNEKAEQLTTYSIISGDIAMSRKGNVGRCAIYPENFPKGIIHSDVLRIRVNHRICNSLFLMHQLHFSPAIEPQIAAVSSGAVMAGINVTKLKSIMVHIPPLALQNEFAAFVEQADKSKFAALLHRQIALKTSLLTGMFSPQQIQSDGFEEMHIEGASENDEL